MMKWLIIENNTGESICDIFNYVFRYFLGHKEEHHEESLRLDGLQAQIRTSDITNTTKNVNHYTVMADINIKTQKCEPTLWSYLFFHSLVSTLPSFHG
jgi:hypothetical protein